MINAATPHRTIEGESFNAATPSNLSYNPINTADNVGGVCGSLLAATTFSSATATGTHFTADQVEWYDKTSSVEMNV